MNRSITNVIRHPSTGEESALLAYERSMPHWIVPSPQSGGNEAEYARVVLRQIEALFDAYFPSPVETLIIKQPGADHLPFLQEILKPQASVYIRRHPIAILNSYLQGGLYKGWDIAKRFKKCRDNVATIRPELLSWLVEAGEDPELQILSMCCLEHQLAADWSAQEKLTLLEYEHLAFGGCEAAINLFAQVGLELLEGKTDELNRLFRPQASQTGFLDTEKQSARRATAYQSELAPWQLSKARRYLERISYEVPFAQQNTRAKVAGIASFSRRELRSLQNSAISRLSLMRKRVLARVSTPS